MRSLPTSQGRYAEFIMDSVCWEEENKFTLGLLKLTNGGVPEAIVGHTELTFSLKERVVSLAFVLNISL